MADHLLLRFEAPLLSFGGETIDSYGVVRDFPAASMVTGLIANALGYRRGDHAAHDRLQTRLVFGARLDRPGTRMRDFQTAQLGKNDTGWTTRGRPEGRRGGAATYDSPHLRYRDYDADAAILVAFRLEPADEAPDLAAIERALDAPARPLFLGRKPCLPSARVVAGRIEAAGVLAALQAAPPLADDACEHPRVCWPAGEGTLESVRRVMRTDRRNWRSGVHGGARAVCEGVVDLPTAQEAAK